MLEKLPQEIAEKARKFLLEFGIEEITIKIVLEWEDGRNYENQLLFNNGPALRQHVQTLHIILLNCELPNPWVIKIVKYLQSFLNDPIERFPDSVHAYFAEDRHAPLTKFAEENS